MPTVPAFHSVHEVQKPPAMREHHTNSECTTGRSIPEHERRPGTSPEPGRGYQRCPDCIGHTARQA